MEPKIDRAFDEIVFAVTKILMGDNRDAQINVFQNAVRFALLHLGVYETLEQMQK